MNTIYTKFHMLQHSDANELNKHDNDLVTILVSHWDFMNDIKNIFTLIYKKNIFNCNALNYTHGEIDTKWYF